MSIEAMNWALTQKTGSPAAKSVLLILANRADHTGKCWPGYNGIAEQTELSRRAVATNIKRLEKMDLLTITKRPKPATNLYRLNLSNSAGGALVQEVHDAAGALPIVQEVHSDSAGGALKPSLTINKPKYYRGANRCPDDFDLTDGRAEFAASVGMDAATLDIEFGNFKDHPYKTKRKDWDAAWRTWCRNWKKWRKDETHQRSDDFESIIARLDAKAGPG